MATRSHCSSIINPNSLTSRPADPVLPIGRRRRAGLPLPPESAKGPARRACRHTGVLGHLAGPLETQKPFPSAARLAYGPNFESAMAALFGGAVSSMSAAAAPTELVLRAPAATGEPQPAADLNALIAEADKDLADYERLTAEGKLGEAGQKLEELSAQ